jgi:hypothetical protein
MSGETEKSASAWTPDLVLAHLTAVMGELEKRLTLADAAANLQNEQRFTAQQQAIKDALTSQKEAVAAALVAAEKAVLVAETNAEKWRMNANEWRASMLDRETKFASRVEMESEFKGIRAEIASLKETRAEGIGGKAMILFLITILGAAATIVGVLVATRG